MGGNGTLSGERVERRLAAILAADVAGYSRLMGQDEAGTLARLKARRMIDDMKIRNMSVLTAMLDDPEQLARCIETSRPREIRRSRI
jgi:hypothetical protein